MYTKCLKVLVEYNFTYVVCGFSQTKLDYHHTLHMTQHGISGDGSNALLNSNLTWDSGRQKTSNFNVYQQQCKFMDEKLRLYREYKYMNGWNHN